MKKQYTVIPAGLIVCICILPLGNATAQVGIAEVIKQGVKKVIRAVDLKIQRLQNETIWLQNAQKAVENQLSKLKLSEIADWTERQRNLYATYYEDLRKVKAAISYYQSVRDLTARSAQLVADYQRGWELVRRDQQFSPEELGYMLNVYTGILVESARNLDRVGLVVRSFSTQMSDANRLKLLHEAAARMDELAADMHQFNRRNILQSFRRAGTESQIRAVQELYGVQNQL